MKNLKIALICGGPSKERGISLNSARSVLDHTQALGVEIVPFFVSQDLKYYPISVSQLYSNTPSDFDFKLQSNSQALNEGEFIDAIRKTDIVFPCIHGEFGEDGHLQKILEHFDVPFIGVDSICADTMYNKNKAAAFLEDKGYPTLQNLHIKRGEDIEGIEEFLTRIDNDRVVVKPTSGGSSIGVHSVERNVEKIKAAIKKTFDETNSDVLIEPFCNGREFTIIILQGEHGKPVPLIPTEIEVSYKNGGIFDYRRKYLPTTNTFWHTPARFEPQQIQRIRHDAGKLFHEFAMRDFARLDGWILDSGETIFTDFNPISGMEQNSFIFQQTSRLGLSHQDTLAHILISACQRYNIDWTPSENIQNIEKSPVYVLFGSDTAERQVSVMSGTNVWLKLLNSEHYEPQLFFMNVDHSIQTIPYSYALNHTVEEIAQNCANSDAIISTIEQYKEEILHDLLLSPSLEISANQSYTLDEFVAKAKGDKAFVFLALHGGLGEDGRLQKKLENLDVCFNGSGSRASRICMDKENTGKIINDLDDNLLSSLSKTLIDINHNYNDNDIEKIWSSLHKESENNNAYIVKPRSDGCSAGIVMITSLSDLKLYLKYINDNATYIPENTFKGQGNAIIELGNYADPYLLIEPYIEVDKIVVDNGVLTHAEKQGWVEYTVGILEQNKNYYALQPSITVAENSVLSLEEKFQGGTGVNITPPPEDILPIEHRHKLRELIEKTAKALGIENYARIDCFYNVKNGKAIIIEANSLPGMTPSTVIYHQALAENPPLKPVLFIEKIIGLKTGAEQLRNSGSKAA